jgi:hypothetical protein
MFQKPVDEKKVARFQKEMEKCLNEIEKVWLDCGIKFQLLIYWPAVNWNNLVTKSIFL